MAGFDERRFVVVAVLVIGLSAVGAGTTIAMLTDTQDATGTITAADRFDKAGPTADAGGPYAVAEGDSVPLDGSGSSASRGNLKDYQWRIVDGPGSLSGADTVDPTYDAPTDVSNDTEVMVELTVTDNKGNSATDTATITVTDSGSGGGTPAIDSLSVSTTGKKERQLVVDTSVSVAAGDSDTLDRVRIEVISTKKGQTVDSTTKPVSGDTATVTETTGQLKNKRQYRVVVTVFDTGGDSASASRTQRTGR